jgi:hypothetical protein
VGGPGTLAGYDFRRVPQAGTDYFQCSGSAEPGTPFLLQPGVPAECDRVALAQAEYRGDLNFDFDLFGDDEDEESFRFSVDTDAQWVVFADAGRGWRVGPSTVGDFQYTKDEIPSLKTFRTDVGIGLQTDVIGFYVAKSVSDSKEPANFFVRVRKRF